MDAPLELKKNEVICRKPKLSGVPTQKNIRFPTKPKISWLSNEYTPSSKLQKISSE